MRWFSFTIILVITIILQTSVSRIFGFGPQRIMPDLFLLLLVVLAYRGNNDQILLACWILGLAKDLTSSAPLGSYALAFGLLALLIRRLRELLYGERLLPMVLVALAGSFLVEQFVLFICVLKGAPLMSQYPRLSLEMLFSAALTAALLPYVYWLVSKLHRQLGLPDQRRYQMNRGH
jgi:rod shape-determining protein MreD